VEFEFDSPNVKESTDIEFSAVCSGNNLVIAGQKKSEGKGGATSAPNDQDDDDPESKGVSVGAVAGIAIAVAVVVGVVAVAVTYVVVKGKKEHVKPDTEIST
jgi:hypothetical protein